MIAQEFLEQDTGAKKGQLSDDLFHIGSGKLFEIMESYHQAKSKEETEEIRKQLKVCISESHKAANNFRTPLPVMAAYLHICLILQSILSKLP